MRIGIFTPPDTVGLASLEALVQQVVKAEKDGFASFWFVQLPHAGNCTLTTISVAGRQTSRIELGTAVIPVYTHHPLALAQQASTAQVATGGRLTLGIGLSHKPVVENIMGLSYDRPARHMREYLSVLRPLINQESVDFAGQSFNVKAGLQVKGASPCPILIAALAPLMLRIAGELADGTVTWMAGRKTIATHIVPRIKDAAESSGRPSPRVCVALPIAVTDDPAGAREYAAIALQRYGELVNYRRLVDIEGAKGPADVAVIGNESEVEQQLQALADAGPTAFLASILPVGEDAKASEARTWTFLSTLNAKLQQGVRQWN
jgi:F420-dependent oxidoreductase-like protein